MASKLSTRSVIPFLVAMMLLTGVCNTLLTKYQDMQCVEHCGSKDPKKHKTFEQPVLQTLQMFVGESGCWLVVLGSFIFKKLYRRGNVSDAAYQPLIADSDRDSNHSGEGGRPSEDTLNSQDALDPTNIVAKPIAHPDVAAETERIPLTGWKILLLALPAVADITGTTLMNVGLLFVAASIYQMTRGALVLFVGLFSVIFLKRRLGGWKWASLSIVVLGVMIVGLAGYLERKHAGIQEHRGTAHGVKDVVVHLLKRAGKEATVTAKEHTPLETLVGILLIACAQIFTASQFVLEESIMEKYSMEPLHVVGWEGVFGFTVTLIGMGVLHLAVGRTHRGGYFDATAGFSQMFHNRTIALTSIAIMISIGGFNFFGLSVTRRISATARSTIDTCRTLFIWLVSMGLGWETFKWLQVPGFALLVYGTSLFNDIIQPPTVRWLRALFGRRSRSRYSE